MTPITSLVVDCQLDYPAIQAGTGRPVHLALRCTAPTRELIRPQPCAFVLVIDRSSSMHGQPLECARQACRTALRHLRTGDYFGLIQFDSQAQVLIPLQPITSSRTALEQKINSITSSGSTNLTGGWMLGRDELKKAPAGVRRRLLLLTDGQLNVGITDPAHVRQIVAHGLESAGIRTATLGFGDNYQADLLRTLATCSGGDFYDADQPEKLPAIFKAELEGLLAITAANLRARIRPLDFCDRWTLISDYPTTRLPDGWTEITIGDLVSAEQRTLVLSLDVLALPLQADGTPLASLDGERLLEIHLLWDEITEHEAKSCRQEQIVRIQAVQRADDMRLNIDAIAAITAQLAGQAVDQASTAIHQDRLKEAEAIVERVEKLIQAYNQDQHTTDARAILDMIKTTLKEGGFTDRTSRSSNYAAATYLKMSSSKIWTAPVAAPISPSFLRRKQGSSSTTTPTPQDPDQKTS